MSSPTIIDRPAVADANRMQDMASVLDAFHNGEPGSRDRLARMIFDDLRAMAVRRLRSERRGLTLQPTMLASDTLMKLIQQRSRFDSGGHLFAIASTMMMRLLIDYHRGRRAARRGGGLVHVTLHADQLPAATGDDVDVEQLNAAMDRLARLDPRKADVVRYRVLWGLTMPQIAETLGASLATVERDWTFARTWLAKELAATA